MAKILIHLLSSNDSYMQARDEEGHAVKCLAAPIASSWETFELLNAFGQPPTPGVEDLLRSGASVSLRSSSGKFLQAHWNSGVVDADSDSPFTFVLEKFGGPYNQSIASGDTVALRSCFAFLSGGFGWLTAERAGERTGSVVCDRVYLIPRSWECFRLFRPARVTNVGAETAPLLVNIPSGPHADGFVQITAPGPLPPGGVPLELASDAPRTVGFADLNWLEGTESHPLSVFVAPGLYRATFPLRVGRTGCVYGATLSARNVAVKSFEPEFVRGYQLFPSAAAYFLRLARMSQGSNSTRLFVFVLGTPIGNASLALASGKYTLTCAMTGITMALTHVNGTDTTSDPTGTPLGFEVPLLLPGVNRLCFNFTLIGPLTASSRLVRTINEEILVDGVGAPGSIIRT